jgi:signal transduction histidine kinase
MERHKLLQMQLKKCQLDSDALPHDLNAWKALIESINKSYVNNDNDCYLLDRSMQLSSVEMKELNERLENAQKFARMAYWSYDLLTRQIIWSKEAYYLFGIDNINDLESFYLLIEEKERTLFKKKITASLSSPQEFDCEIQIQKPELENNFSWYRIIGKTIFDKESDKPICINFVAIDITSKKLAENEFSRLNNQLIISARRAGMADVATSVLHNVGNILNSANVSLALINENINDQAINKLKALKELMNQNIDRISEYLSYDEKGKLIPKYFIALTTRVTQLHDAIQNEINNLNEQLQHIKDITTMQKDISGISNIRESIFVNDLLDTSIMMCDPAMEAKSIKIIKHYNDNLFIHSDRVKILQILVNLIQNAKESLLSVTDTREKTLTLSCHRTDSLMVKIYVEDNGMGMSEDTLKKICTFGFTTKKTGHGFGMHSSSLAAKELNGDLLCMSDGMDKGATITLTLPIRQSKREVSYESRHEFENHCN